MILGGGPNRIGQGIEFDYCCVHASLALKKLGFETIIVNCNPETVSTDYDTSDKLYFEPLTLEDVLSIYKKEKPVGVIAQFGGQTPLNLAADLEKNGVKILGTAPSVIDLAEDRDLFRAMMEKLEIPMPESGMAVTVDDALEIAEKIGYPVMVRPSYVLGGRGMEVVYDAESMVGYMNAAVGVTPDRPILIDRFLGHATECEADAISDGTHAFVPAVMEHIELAGVHSGDSACIIPSKCKDDQRIYEKDCGRDACQRSDEHAVCDRKRKSIRAGGKPESIPYRAACIQGMQHPHGTACNRYCYIRTDRKTVSGSGTERTGYSVLRRKRIRIPVQYVPGSRPALRTGNAFNRRGTRTVPLLWRSVLQSTGGNPDEASAGRYRIDFRKQPRQTGSCGSGTGFCTRRIQDHRIQAYM